MILGKGKSMAEKTIGIEIAPETIGIFSQKKIIKFH